MKESFDQHEAQTPRPATGSRQAAHSGGNAISSTRRRAVRVAPAARLNGVGRAISDNIPRHASAAERECHRLPRMDRKALGDTVRVK
jgi:hypothetical protein